MNINAKLFVSTFVLIFLAELGDKTQLAAMAKSIEGRLTVFLAASAALICSTLIAVLFGDALTHIVQPRYLQMAAAILFIVFGGVMLRNVFVEQAPTVGAEKIQGTFELFVAQTALAFEEAAEEDYRELAGRTDNEVIRRVLLGLADDERSHQERIRAARMTEREQDAFASPARSDLPDLAALLHDVAQDQAKPFLNHAIEHELATAAFYNALAKTAKLPGLKRTLRTLAQEEQGHAHRLRELEAKLQA